MFLAIKIDLKRSRRLRQVFQPGRTITKELRESIAVYAVLGERDRLGRSGRRLAGQPSFGTVQKLKCVPWLFALAVAWLAAGCGRQTTSPGLDTGGASAASPQSASAVRTFDAKGIVVLLPPSGNTVVIRHEAISNYMAGMTMPFEVKDTNELRGLQPGDAIAFRLVVTPTSGWIDRVNKLNRAPQPVPAREAIHFSPAVESLSEGDTLPDFHFTNELGQPIDLRQFRGQTLAFTFFFTSCPFPNFCPRMTANFSGTADKLVHSANAPPRWHLFSISFDTSKDTPGHLLDYATAHHYDSAHWSFLTSDPHTIGQFAELFDERYWNEGQTIGHNLRTIVVSPSGRIRKIFDGSSWTSGQLTAAMIAAKQQ